jgi:hypothetical protein
MAIELMQRRLKAIQPPQEEESGFSKLAPIVGTIGGGIAGAFVGNPLLGASIGGALGNVAKGAVNKDLGQAVDGAVQGLGAAQGGAMNRRAEQIQKLQLSKLQPTPAPTPTLPAPVQLQTQSTPKKPWWM